AELVEVKARGQHEHAAVPEVLARGDISLRCRCVRLLDEGGKLEPVAAGLAAPKIAVARLRGRRHDAEADQSARRGGADGSLDGLGEGGYVLNCMVRRERQQDGVRVVGGG